MSTAWTVWYWSSSEYSEYSAWDVIFENGHESSSLKGYPEDVRAVLAF